MRTTMERLAALLLVIATALHGTNAQFASLFDFGMGGGMNPFGGMGYTDPFAGAGGMSMGMGMGRGGANPPPPVDPAAMRDAQMSLAGEQLAETLTETGTGDPARQRVEQMLKRSGGRLTGEAASLNYLVEEFMATVPPPTPPPEQPARPPANPRPYQSPTALGQNNKFPAYPPTGPGGAANSRQGQQPQPVHSWPSAQSGPGGRPPRRRPGAGGPGSGKATPPATTEVPGWEQWLFGQTQAPKPKPPPKRQPGGPSWGGKAAPRSAKGRPTKRKRGPPSSVRGPTARQHPKSQAWPQPPAAYTQPKQSAPAPGPYGPPPYTQQTQNYPGPAPPGPPAYNQQTHGAPAPVPYGPPAYAKRTQNYPGPAPAGPPAYNQQTQGAPAPVPYGPPAYALQTQNAPAPAPPGPPAYSQQTQNAPAPAPPGPPAYSQQTQNAPASAPSGAPQAPPAKRTSIAVERLKNIQKRIDSLLSSHVGAPASGNDMQLAALKKIRDILSGKNIKRPAVQAAPSKTKSGSPPAIPNPLYDVNAKPQRPPRSTPDLFPQYNSVSNQREPYVPGPQGQSQGPAIPTGNINAQSQQVDTAAYGPAPLPATGPAAYTQPQGQPPAPLPATGPAAYTQSQAQPPAPGPSNQLGGQQQTAQKAAVGGHGTAQSGGQGGGQGTGQGAGQGTGQGAGQSGGQGGGQGAPSGSTAPPQFGDTKLVGNIEYVLVDADGFDLPQWVKATPAPLPEPQQQQQNNKPKNNKPKNNKQQNNQQPPA